MNVVEQARFSPLFESMQRALKLQGKAKATKDAYSRAVRRTAAYFDRCPDDLSAEELRKYFADLLETHSWSTIKLDRCGLQFLGPQGYLWVRTARSGGRTPYGQPVDFAPVVRTCGQPVGGSQTHIPPVSHTNPPPVHTAPVRHGC